MACIWWNALKSWGFVHDKDMANSVMFFHHMVMNALRFIYAVHKKKISDWTWWLHGQNASFNYDASEKINLWLYFRQRFVEWLYLVLLCCLFCVNLIILKVYPVVLVDLYFPVIPPISVLCMYHLTVIHCESLPINFCQSTDQTI